MNNKKGDLSWQMILIFILLLVFLVFMLVWIITSGSSGLNTVLDKVSNLFG